MRRYYNSVSLCPAYSAGRKSLGVGGGEGKSERKDIEEKREMAGGERGARLMSKDKVREGRRRCEALEEAKQTAA